MGKLYIMNTNSAIELFEDLRKKFGTTKDSFQFNQFGFNERYDVIEIKIGNEEHEKLFLGLSRGKDTVTFFSDIPPAHRSYEQAPEALKLFWDNNGRVRISQTLNVSTYTIDSFCKKIQDAIYTMVHAERIKQESLGKYAKIENEFS